MYHQLDEISLEIYRKYRPALRAIGVNTTREDVQEAMANCHTGMEGVFQRVIEYWLYLQQQQQSLDYPSALLIQALQEQWTPRNWQESYLEDSRLQSICTIWWEEAAKKWGTATRDELIADISDRSGEEIIELRSGGKISLKIATLRGWEWILENAREQAKSTQWKSI